MVLVHLFELLDLTDESDLPVNVAFSAENENITLFKAIIPIINHKKLDIKKAHLLKDIMDRALYFISRNKSINMSLKEYQEKRKFGQTPEPSSGDASTGVHEAVFVVQKHDASRLHFDFRLEADGALKSWAVPKGPSMNPRDKRLAVQVEDHPLAYGSFEGTIPEGNYGAGTVEIWDSGTYSPVEKHRDADRAIADGVLEFTIHGRKLKGLFTLVRTDIGDSDKNWLLVKKDDSYAVHSPYDAAKIP